MNAYESKVFGEVPQPKTFGELMALVADAEVSGRRVRMWRGQADICWPVHSTAYRRIVNTRQSATERSLRQYEQSLLNQARHRGYGTSDGKDLSDLELLARLRHHGAATRLIDATRSWIVGLWFTVCTHDDRVGALIGVHTDFMLGYEGIPEKKGYDELVQTLEETKDIWTWEPTNVSTRVAAQHSQFLASTLVDEKTGSVVLPGGDGHTLVIAISPEAKRRFSKLLIELFDIRHITLFPDLDGFGHFQNEDYPTGSGYRW